MARIKLAYPKIPGSDKAPLETCIAFEKYDGTNLHWVWQREFGWRAFGMRRNRYCLNDEGVAEFQACHPDCRDAPDLFQRELAEPLEDVFRLNSNYAVPEITVFTEYCGKQSFAGTHKVDDQKQLILFDVAIGEEILPPHRFINDFSQLRIARIVYRGKLTGKFAEDVRQGRYDVGEGVVCKGGKTSDKLWMVKIKTNQYLERLKQVFQSDWDDYWE